MLKNEKEKLKECKKAKRQKMQKCKNAKMQKMQTSSVGLGLQLRIGVWGLSLYEKLVVVVVIVLVGENKVNSYSNQLMLGWVCKFPVEFDQNEITKNAKKNKENIKLR